MNSITIVVPEPHPVTTFRVTETGQRTVRWRDGGAPCLIDFETETYFGGEVTAEHALARSADQRVALAWEVQG
jgi:hypothetical protein